MRSSLVSLSPPPGLHSTVQSPRHILSGDFGSRYNSKIPVPDSPTDANSYSVFWHQQNSRKFSSIANYIVHEQLGLPRHVVSARYIRVLVAFLASGVLHFIGDSSAGIPVRQSGALRFFLTQAGGLIMEDLVSKLYFHPERASKPSNKLERVVGFVWVASFLTWSVPAYVYPMMWRTQLGLNDSTIPFTLFESNSERIKAVISISVLGLVPIFLFG